MRKRLTTEAQRLHRDSQRRGNREDEEEKTVVWASLAFSSLSSANL
jgi:hypothetical protein